ncbi:PREDICTED: ankyrin repeat domain-containing protein SOWAHA [Nanorana parkeri]|uniref:ankyrin repeat domain-containing protein SOWAHA n=1 Tax=Nanorana parkeri TaxID=125878 RepID=UPI0008544C68|nr:PREDICTED: ankyrin repeat domain-containing protein SOWAHA [Nanorana parkeri]
MAVKQEVVLNFLLEQGGKVKNSDLIKTFKHVVESPDPQEKANNRDLFKRFVNNIAVVKDEDGCKVVVLKKKYAHLLAGVVQSTNAQEEEVGARRHLQEEPQPLPVSDNNTEEPSISTDSKSASLQELSEPQYHELKDSGAGECGQESTDQEERGNLQKLENEETRESVSDIVSRMHHSGPVPVPKSWSDGQSKEMQKPHMLPLRYAQSSFDDLDANQNENTSVPLAIPLSMVQESPPLDLPQVAPLPTIQEGLLPALPRSPHVGRRHLDDVGSKSPHMKRASKIMKASEENKYSDVVPLFQHEHEWLVTATNGRWNHKLLGLMLKDSELADKRDFISGFTALHWAAKSGNTEMVKLLFDSSRKGDANVNVNVRSFGGYTPLHIAAIHERKDVIIMLIRDYSAEVHVRDNSGRKPYHYLKKECAVQLRYILKDPAYFNMEHTIPVKRNSKVGASIFGTTTTFLGVISDDIAFHDLTRGFRKPSSLNKFFTAPSATKKKLKTKDNYPSVSSLSEEPEEVVEVVGKRRPLTEVFFQ